MRLITRGDLDGLTSAVLITLNEQIDEIRLIHPQDITNGQVDIGANDILANVPYHPQCAKWFDHHVQTDTNPKPPANFEGAYGLAPSAARLVFDYYGGAAKMPQHEKLVAETDRLDSAQLTMDDILDPQDYIRLGFTIDGRTGLGAFHDYFLLLHDLLKTQPIDEILKHPEVKARWSRIQADEAEFKRLATVHSRVEGNLVITDYRDVDTLPVGNRFLIYALYPEANVSLRIHWGPQKKFVIAAMGHSILKRTCQTSIAELAARFGGGGHRGAGTAPLPPEKADTQLAEIIAALKESGQPA
jgi:hypothetical protein